MVGTDEVDTMIDATVMMEEEEEEVSNGKRTKEFFLLCSDSFCVCLVSSRRGSQWSVWVVIWRGL